MNFKACCGLLAGNKDDEDHDYEDVGQEPLPKPRPAADLRPKVGVCGRLEVCTASRGEVKRLTPCLSCVLCSLFSVLCDVVTDGATAAT